MYKIVLADDEENIRNLVAKKINQSIETFEVVGIAENGLEAIKLVSEYQPDILITDICMPLLDGLELIKKVNEIRPSIKTIIISGYDDFSYAKAAVTLGVEEYLLKPFRAEELFEVLNRVKLEIDKEMLFVRNIEYMHYEIERKNSEAKEKLILKLLEGELKEKELEIEKNMLEIELNFNWYCVGIIRFWDAVGNVILDSHKKQLDKFIDLVNSNYFSSAIQNYIVINHNQQLVILICGNQKTLLCFKDDLQQGLEKINTSMGEYYDLRFNCIIGKAYSDVNYIPHSYKEALTAWRSSLDEVGCVLGYETYETQIADIKNSVLQRPKDLENNLLLNIQLCHYEEAMKSLNSILAYYSPIFIINSGFVSVAIIELVFNISEAMGRAGGNLKAWQDEGIINYLRKHFISGSLMEAKIVLQEYILRCCDQFTLMGEKSGDKIVHNMKTIIDQKLNVELFSLDDLAEELHFSPNYLRQLFKQKTGESFKEYFIRKRMEKAGELIKATNMKVQDIAANVGYSDQRYFSRCFKKYFECTPSEFRENNKGIS